LMGVDNPWVARRHCMRGSLARGRRRRIGCPERAGDRRYYFSRGFVFFVKVNRLMGWRRNPVGERQMVMFWFSLADGRDKGGFMPAKSGPSGVSGGISGTDGAARGGKIRIVRRGGFWRIFLLPRSNLLTPRLLALAKPIRLELVLSVFLALPSAAAASRAREETSWSFSDSLHSQRSLRGHGGGRGWDSRSISTFALSRSCGVLGMRIR
jgi:hypothetical protein